MFDACAFFRVVWVTFKTFSVYSEIKKHVVWNTCVKNLRNVPKASVICDYMDPPHGVHNILNLHNDEYKNNSIYGCCSESEFRDVLSHSWPALIVAHFYSTMPQITYKYFVLGRENRDSLRRFSVTPNGSACCWT